MNNSFLLLALMALLATVSCGQTHRDSPPLTDIEKIQACTPGQSPIPLDDGQGTLVGLADLPDGDYVFDRSDSFVEKTAAPQEPGFSVHFEENMRPNSAGGRALNDNVDCASGVTPQGFLDIQTDGIYEIFKSGTEMHLRSATYSLSSRYGSVQMDTNLHNTSPRFLEDIYGESQIKIYKMSDDKIQIRSFRESLWKIYLSVTLQRISI